jgi:hypothetical protein
MGKVLPKEKRWGVRNCRERKCPELRKNTDTAFPEDAQERCQIFNTMPGTLPCCIRDMDNMPPEEFLRHAVYHLRDTWEKDNNNRKTPGPKNCPKTCPYKISEQGEVFGKTGASRWEKKPGTIWKFGILWFEVGGGTEKKKDSPLDYTPFNTWQMANCAACTTQGPCETRSRYLMEFGEGKMDTRAPCPERVPEVKKGETFGTEISPCRPCIGRAFCENYGNPEKGCQKESPNQEWLTKVTYSMRASCPGHHWEVWKIIPEGEYVCEGGRTEKEAKATKKRLQEGEKGSRFEVRKRPTVESEKP